MKYGAVMRQNLWKKSKSIETSARQGTVKMRKYLENTKKSNIMFHVILL